MTEAPSEIQMDALREVANVGCGHAATALSQLVGGRTVQIDVPRVVVSPALELGLVLGGSDKKVVVAVLGLQGELSGWLVLALAERDARLLTTLMLKEPSIGKFSSVERSALGEAANIVASACLSAIGKLTGLRLLPSTPQIAHDIAGQVMTRTLGHLLPTTQPVVAIEVRFHTAGTPSMGGQLLLIPDSFSLKLLLERLGV